LWKSRKIGKSVQNLEVDPSIGLGSQIRIWSGGNAVSPSYEAVVRTPRHSQKLWLVALESWSVKLDDKKNPNKN
jgi:hypothetical protein